MGLGSVAPSTYQNPIKLDELELNDRQWQHPTNEHETSWGASTSILDKHLSMLGSASK